MDYMSFKNQLLVFNNSLQKWEHPVSSDEIRAEYELGKQCGECGKENDFSDDCGWFYGYVAETHYVPHCYKCWSSKGYQTGER